MSRPVFLSSRAQRDFDTLAPAAKRRVRAGLLAFAETGRGDLKKLRGLGSEQDLFRLRVGEYRVIFAATDGEIRVTRIIARSEGYDWL